MATLRIMRPQQGPQEMFLSSEADIVFYGGAAGGGKTYALLLEAVRYIDRKGGSATIFRRESVQITNQGGLWDTAQELYAERAEPVGNEMRFSSGERVIFAHLNKERDVYGYQSAQIPMMGFDELTHFTRKQFFYMLGRNRSPHGIPCRIRGTYNPVPPTDPIGGWIHEFVEWYLDDNLEYPDESKSGVVRWFVNHDDKLHWFDSKSAALEAFPNIPPKSFTFIPAKVTDNQILLDNDPGYMANLFALNLVEREQLKEGNHKIRPAAGLFFNRDWFRIIEPYEVPELERSCGYFDPAATEKRHSDNSGYVEMGISGANIYVLYAEDGKYGPGKLERWMAAKMTQSNSTNKGDIFYKWENQPAAAGVLLNADWYVKFREFNASSGAISGDKMVRAKPYARQCEEGMVYLVRAEWNDRYLDVLHGFPDAKEKGLVDASSGAYNEIKNAGFEIWT